jgi:hypothetical protein
MVDGQSSIVNDQHAPNQPIRTNSRPWSEDRRLPSISLCRWVCLRSPHSIVTVDL